MTVLKRKQRPQTETGNRPSPGLALLTTARQTTALATLTFRELIREKILWSSFVFAVLCVGLAYAVSQLSFTENARIALDFGFTSIALVGGLLAVVMGATLVAKEVRNRTLYLVLTKSVWRWQFVLGRFLGLSAVLCLNAALMAAALLAIYGVTGGKPSAAIAKCLLLLLTEFGVLSAVACVFSALSTATLAAVLAAGVWVIGHAMTDIRILAERMEPAALRPVLGFVARALPDLTRFDIKAEMAHDLYVSWGHTATAMGYGVAYIAFALTASCLIFLRREL